MSTFWKLYSKEIRFLTGPGIGLIVLINSWIPLSIIYFVSPEFYEVNIPEFVQLLDTATINYLYAGLFLYSILHEHITRSEYQLWMLPARRSPHLTAKLASVVTWVVISLPASIMLQSMTRLVKRVLPWFGELTIVMVRASAEVVVLGTVSAIIGVLSLCTLVMLAYSLAMAIRRYQYLIGVVTVGTGLIVIEWLPTTIYRFLAELFPYQSGVSTLMQIQPWSTSIALSLVTALLFVSALLLYERFGEV